MKHKIVFFCFQLFFCGSIMSMAESHESSPEVSDASVEAVEKELGDACTVALTIYYLHSLMKDALTLGSRLKSYIKPSAQEQCKALVVRMRYDYLKQKRAFKDCLINNVRGEVRRHGVPKECEQLAGMVAIMGGHEELDGLMEVFKKVRETHFQQEG